MMLLQETGHHTEKVNLRGGAWRKGSEGYVEPVSAVHRVDEGEL